MPSDLLSVADADHILAAVCAAPGAQWPAEGVPLVSAAGRILREDVCADRAYPAQDRSRMDGIAIRFEDLTALESSGAARTFSVVGLARAGDPRLTCAARAACVEIMTGAAVPHGCDTVIPYEEVRIEEGVAHVLDGVTVRPAQCVHREGSDCAAGTVLVSSGTRLTAAHVAIAASVGKHDLFVARRPRVSIVATGDELVAVDQVPLPHQLRVSNAYGLAALLAPWADTRIHRASDDPDMLAAALRAALLSFDLVLVSGGVSAGKFDAVPSTLEALGVRKVFHKLAQKPGKPLWFGLYDGLNESFPPLPLGEGLGVRVTPQIPVFGLPGNPVSALVCARRFVLPLLWAKLGWIAPPTECLPLGSAVDAPSRLTHYLPVKLEKRPETGAHTVAEPRAVNGSGDFATLGASDGFVELPASQNHYPAGAQMAFFAWSP
jgi:molybdopterin molybdotransferase